MWILATVSKKLISTISWEDPNCHQIYEDCPAFLQPCLYKADYHRSQYLCDVKSWSIGVLSSVLWWFFWVKYMQNVADLAEKLTNLGKKFATKHGCWFVQDLWLVRPFVWILPGILNEVQRHFKELIALDKQKKGLINVEKWKQQNCSDLRVFLG